VATHGQVPRGRPNLEVGDAHWESPLEREWETLRDLLVEKLAHILRRKERSESIPKVTTLKSSRKPNYPLSMEILRRWKFLIGLKKHFKVYDYSENLKAQITIFNLNGKDSIWWEDLKNVKRIHEKELSWKQFEKHFKKKYLSEKYFDEKTKEFYELKLGQLNIEEYINKFLELLRYVPYIKDEKVKVQRFINGLHQTYRNKIEFDEPKTLEDTI
jgi:hypothetical protein